MYKIIKDGVLVGKVESLLYVKKRNNVWIESPEKEAEAISFNGFVYPINEVILHFEDVGEQIGSADVDLANLELKDRLGVQGVVDVMITNKCKFTKEQLESLRGQLLESQVKKIEEGLLQG
jgi:hypothetical protein